MHLVDAEVTRDEWFALANRGVIARIKGPTPEELLRLQREVDANPKLRAFFQRLAAQVCPRNLTSPAPSKPSP